MLRALCLVLAGGVAAAQLQVDLRAQVKGVDLSAVGPAGDFTPTRTSSSVITVAGGTFRYGTNVNRLPGPITFTLQTVSIVNIASGGATTTVNTAVPLVNLVNGQAINIHLTGTGAGCAAGTGVFVATALSPTSFQIPANTSAGCSGLSGTVGAATGGTAILYGNTSGQIE